MSGQESGGSALLLRLHRLPAASRHVVDLGATARPAPTPTPLARWSASVAAAHDACLVLDRHGRVVAMSAPAATLLGTDDVGVVGRPFLAVVDVVDFETGHSDPDYAGRVGPLEVLSSDALMRTLLRLRRHDGTAVTLDTSSAPLHEVGGGVVGSLTFFFTLGS